MMPAKTAVSAWLGMSGQCNSRIELLYQAMEDQDMPALRAILEAVYAAGWLAGMRLENTDAMVASQPSLRLVPPLHSIGSRGE